MRVPPWAARLLPMAIWTVGWLPFLHGNLSVADALAALAATGLALVTAHVMWPVVPTEIEPWRLLTVAGCTGVGLVLDRTLPIALALMVFAGVGNQPSARRADELRLLALLSLPWLVTDGASLALAFRHSAAWAAGFVFHSIGFDVVRDGTTIDIEGQPLAVAAACAGLDTLHATLVAGAWLAGALRQRRRFWLGIAGLPLLAWTANTTRVIALGAVGLTWGPAAALGWFHTWGGLAVIVVMFGLAGAWVGVLRRAERIP